MLNPIQHLIISRTYEILKQVQDDKPVLFTRPSIMIKPYFFIFSTFQHSNILIFRFFLVVPADLVPFRDGQFELFFQPSGDQVRH